MWATCRGGTEEKIMTLSGFPGMLVDSTIPVTTGDHTMQFWVALAGPPPTVVPRRYNFDVSNEKVQQVASADFPTRWGQFRIHGFTNGNANGAKIEEAVALVMGDDLSGSPLVRIHSQCLTGDVFGSLRCDCRQQLEIALSMIAREGPGVLVYEQQEGRGIGLMAKLQAYALQDGGMDTVQANEKLSFKAEHREFQLPVEILKVLGIKQ